VVGVSCPVNIRVQDLTYPVREIDFTFATRAFDIGCSVFQWSVFFTPVVEFNVTLFPMVMVQIK
jgi:hypothetical protein